MALKENCVVIKTHSHTLTLLTHKSKYATTETRVHFLKHYADITENKIVSAFATVPPASIYERYNDQRHPTSTRPDTRPPSGAFGYEEFLQLKTNVQLYSD